MISVVIPTLNDAVELAQGLERLAPYRDEIEILVVDGGSIDGTHDVLKTYPWVKTLYSPPGRGRQLRAGTEAATGDTVLFLHADSHLAQGWLQAVERATCLPGFALGAFRLRLTGPGWPRRLVERTVNLRSRLFRLPYGDQALFTTRPRLTEIGGVPDQPLMEDVEMVWRLRKLGRFVSVPATVETSTRNWDREGYLRRTLRNWTTYMRYKLGVAPSELAAYYRAGREAVFVFCKEPVPGKVKTRLAADTGEQYATSLYRALVEKTLDAVADCPRFPEAFVSFDPPSAADRIRQWLGHRWRYVSQAQGDLGERMSTAFAYAARSGYERTVLIGTDCPGLEAGHLDEAFRRLEQNDLVLGPSTDGGYYLIGARKVHPELFADMLWSTEEVMERTMERATRAGLKVVRLEELRDLDDKADLEAHRLAGTLPPDS